MTVFQSDRASADLTLLEEGALRGLASLGINSDIAGLAEFCAGFVSRPAVAVDELRAALFALDALGWVVPTNGDPQTSGRWFVTGQGRVALEATA